LGESASFKVCRENPSTRFCCRRQQEKKKWKGRKDRQTKSQVGYISAIWGADPVGPISTKTGKAVRVDDVIIQSNFGFNIF